MAETGWIASPVWSGWGNVTRLHGSALIAFATERERWSSTAYDEMTEVIFSDSGSEFRAYVSRHSETLQDTSLLNSFAFLRYFSLTETHCRFSRYIVDKGRWDLIANDPSMEEIEEIESITLSGGIETWSQQILDLAGQSWAQIYGGKAGLVELSIVRNALAHGRTKVTRDMIANARKRGVELPLELGEDLQLRFPIYNEYRGRLRSFCRIISDGLVHRYRTKSNT
jgi:hypothetical protein